MNHHATSLAGDAALRASFNPLDVIDPEGDFAVDDAGRIAAAIDRHLAKRIQDADLLTQAVHVIRTAATTARSNSGVLALGIDDHGG